MAIFDDILTQILQPYFFYSLVFLVIAFACIKVFLRFSPSMSKRSQSLLWLLPLSIPVFLLLFFQPQLLVTNHFSPAEPLSGVNFWKAPSVFSITGLLCLGGAAIAAGYFTVTVLLGKKIVMKSLHVFLMAPEEYVDLQREVKESARKLGIAEPKVGLTGDLRPNAFTVGYGKNAVVVFSLGILQTLEIEELRAVVSHELAHVKSRDWLFRSISNSLIVFSFFNPFAYLAASQAQRERELLADERGVALLGKPKLMTTVLLKLQRAAQEFPKVHIANRLSASLFLVSPFANRPEILASHPQISHRIQNISVTEQGATKKRLHVLPTLFLIAILMSTAVLGVYAAVQVEGAYFYKESSDSTMNILVDGQSIIYNATDRNCSLPYAVFLSPNESLFTQNGNFSVESRIMVNNPGPTYTTNEPGTIDVSPGIESIGK